MLVTVLVLACVASTAPAVVGAVMHPETSASLQGTFGKRELQSASVVGAVMRTETSAFLQGTSGKRELQSASAPLLWLV